MAMRRSLVVVSAELKEKFEGAQLDPGVRWLLVAIEQEQFVCSGCAPVGLDAEADFAQLKTSLDRALLVLFCAEPKAPAKRWTLIAFVPESSPVRLKMLYSSSRESLKSQLGHSYFLNEFHATDLTEMDYQAFCQAKAKIEFDDSVLTDAERRLKETNLLEKDTNVKSTAMGVVPFKVSDELRQKLELFKNGKLGWVEMTLNSEKESVELVSFLSDVDPSDLASKINPTEPSFIAFNNPNGAQQQCLIYSCPEEAPIRLKMMYSTCKATILAATGDIGIDFEKMVEIRDPNDINEELSDVSIDSSQLRSKSFSKPTAPGRGRRRKGPVKLSS